MSLGEIFNTLFFNPIVNLLALIFQTLSLLHIPGTLGFSIIVLTVLIRLLIWPVMTSQLRSAKKMADLKPHLDSLKLKHKDNKQALASAQMDLYKEHGINPAGGCLPALIQIPIIWALYQTIFAFFSGNQGLTNLNNALYPFIGHFNSSPDLNFFGLNLATKPAEFTKLGGLLLLIPIITAILQLVQSKMMAPRPVPTYPGDTNKEKEEKEKTEDAMTAVQSQMTYMMPLMVGYFAFQFPIGLALYWNTFTILGIIQQYFVSGWGGLEEWKLKFQKF